tara:strand:+ start:100 stop:480 length:381 start_codon:yes stop_codon:yes gene_type:complete
LHFAVENGHTTMVEYLLKKGGVDVVNARDKLLRTPLHISCLQAHCVLTSLLLEYNANLFEKDKSGRSSLHFAACTGSALAACELMTLLCKDGDDLLHMKDHTGRTPLHYAIYNGSPGQNKIIEKLL